MNAKIISLLLICSASFSTVQCAHNKEFLKKRILFRDDVSAALAVLNDGSGLPDAAAPAVDASTPAPAAADVSAALTVLSDASNSSDNAAAVAPAAPIDPVAPAVVVAPVTPVVIDPTPAIVVDPVVTPAAPVIVAPVTPIVVNPAPVAPVVAPAAPAAPVMGAFEYSTNDLETIRKITSLLSLIEPSFRAVKGVEELTCAGVDTMYRQAYALTSTALEGDTLEARVSRVLRKINSIKGEAGIFKWKKASAQNTGIEALVATLVEVAHNYSGQGISKLLPHDEQRLLRRAVRATTGAAVETAAELAAYKLQKKLELSARPTTLKERIDEADDGDSIASAVGVAFAEKLIQNLTYQILGEILLAGANDVESRDYVADLKATLCIKR